MTSTYKIHHQAPLFRIIGIGLLAAGTLFCGISVRLFASDDDWVSKMSVTMIIYLVIIAASIFFGCIYNDFPTKIELTESTVKIHYPMFLFRKINISDITNLHILRYNREHFSKYRRGTESRMRLEIYLGEKLIVLNDKASDRSFNKLPDKDVTLRRFYKELIKLTENNDKEE